MKKQFAIMLILALTFSLLTACADKPSEPIEDEHNYGKIIYVSPNGNDENNGEKGSPVASLVGAVKAMRDYRSQNGLPEGGIKIEFAAGTYNITEGITLTAEDSGTEDKPIVFAGANDAKVLFNGGISLNPADFMPADEDFKALLQTEEAKQNVVMINLAKAGCYDLDSAKEYYNKKSTDIDPNFSAEADYYRQELFVNGKRQSLARWPNEPYCNPEIDREVEEKDSKEGYVLIYISEKQAELWRSVDKIEFYGLPIFEWANTCISDIDVAEDKPALMFPVIKSDFGITSDCLYYVYNIPCELDSPGEYYWDTKTNFLYYWPTDEFETAGISFSQLSEVPFTLDECSYISLENLSAVSFRNSFINGEGDHISINKCHLSGIDGTAAIIIQGDYNTVTGCLIHDLAAGGVIITTGDTATQTMGKTIVSDNIIYDFSQIYTIYNPAVGIKGHGAEVSHNEIYNCAHCAISICAGQCDIAYNNVHDCCLEVGDGGAIYTWGRFIWAGNVFRYNYVHRIGDILNPILGLSRPGAGSGMFFDFWGKYSLCYGNVFADVRGCCMCGAGGHMTYQNNLCINVGEPINISYWGVTDMSNAYDNTWLKDDIRRYDYLNRIWRFSSPRTALFVEVADQKINPNCIDLPLAAAYNIVQNNVRFIDSNSDFKPFDCDTKENYTKDGIIRTSDYYFALSPYMDNACYTDVDPGFTDYANGDYSLKKDSRVFRDLIGFENIDMSVFGPRAAVNPFK